MQSPDVLFIWTGNTARSQRPQVMPGHQGGARFRGVSAELEPGEVDPWALNAWQERSCPTSHLQARGWRPLVGEQGIGVVTVGARAEANGPVSPDPTAIRGLEEGRPAAFWQVRDDIDTRLQIWVRGWA